MNDEIPGDVCPACDGTGWDDWMGGPCIPCEGTGWEL